MDLFVLQCLSGKEETVRRKIQQSGASPFEAIHIPRRQMKVRRAGKIVQEEYLLFPGYIFFEASDIDPSLINQIRNIPEAIRFLPDNQTVSALPPAERELMGKLLYHGEIIGDSAVRFDENRRIAVIRGPLKGLEGNIIKVNRRKGRAKVRLDMYDRTFEVDFSFFDLEQAGSAED